MSIGAFAVVAARERELNREVTVDDLAGMGWERPFLGIALLTFMLGFAGLPLTGGFFAKFYAFAAAYETGWWWLMLVGVAATVVSLYYYLAVIRASTCARPWSSSSRPRAAPRRASSCSRRQCWARSSSPSARSSSSPLIDWAQDAASSLPLSANTGVRRRVARQAVRKRAGFVTGSSRGARG